MNPSIVTIALFVAAMMAFAQANPIIERTKLNDCIVELETKMLDVNVPNEILELGKKIRAMNWNIERHDTISMSKFFTSHSTNLNLFTTGIIKPEQTTVIRDLCVNFIEDGFIKAAKETKCGAALVDELIPPKDSFSLVVERRPLDEKLGNVLVCRAVMGL